MIPTPTTRAPVPNAIARSRPAACEQKHGDDAAARENEQRQTADRRRVRHHELPHQRGAERAVEADERPRARRAPASPGGPRRAGRRNVQAWPQRRQARRAAAARLRHRHDADGLRDEDRAEDGVDELVGAGRNWTNRPDTRLPSRGADHRRDARWRACPCRDRGRASRPQPRRRRPRSPDPGRPAPEQRVDAVRGREHPHATAWRARGDEQDRPPADVVRQRADHEQRRQHRQRVDREDHREMIGEKPHAA